MVEVIRRLFNGVHILYTIYYLTNYTMKKRIWNYAKSIWIPVIIWAIVWIVMNSFIDYSTLNLPSLAPSSVVFPIVWTILYILMWISYWIVLDKWLVDKKLNILYYTQLWVNALWSILFFILKWRRFSFWWIILLDILVLILIIKLYKMDKIAWLSQILYMFRILFASYLTLAVCLMN